MKRLIDRCGAVVLGCAVASLLWGASAAKAIGPDYQYIPDSGYGGGGVFGAMSSPTLNDVVGLGSAAGFVSGTGTVIGVATQGTTTYLSILTALHVMNGATPPTTVDFGAGFAGTSPVISQNNGAITASNIGFVLKGTITTGLMTTYTLPGQAKPEDMAIVQATITTAQAPAGSLAAAELSLVTNPANTPQVSNAFGGGANQGFTEFGDGRGGIYNLQNNPAAGGSAIPATVYSAFFSAAPAGFNTSNGLRRFQNNNSTGLSAPAASAYSGGAYFQPQVSFAQTAPGIAGNMVTGMGGVGYQGDSGGPLMTTATGDSVIVTPNLVNNPAAAKANAVPTLVPVNDTNNESAVFVSNNGSAITDAGGNTIGRTLGIGAASAAVPLLTAAQTNALTGAMPPTDAAPSPSYVNPNRGSLDWAMQYTTLGLLYGNTAGNIINRVNGAGGGPISIPEPGALALAALGGLMMVRRLRRRAAFTSTTAMILGATLSVPMVAQAQFAYPTNEPAANTYVPQQQSQFSAAASILMVLNSGSPTPINYTTTGAYATVQQNLSAMIAQNNGTNPSNVFVADAFGIQGTLKAIDNTRTYVPYVGFTGAGNGPNQANYTLAYNISHYKQDGTALMMQMNRVTNTPTYRWMDVYGFTSPAKTGPPTSNPNTAYTINGFYVRDPWYNYYKAAGTSAAIKASTSQAISSNMFLENGNNLLWNQMFKPYQPYMPTAVGAGATITNVPDVNFTKAPYAGVTAINHYQFVADPDEQDIAFNTEDTSSDTQATSDSIAIADAQDAFSGASEGGADTGLAALPEFQGGSFQTTGDEDITLPFVPDDSEWVLGYYPSGGSAPTGIVVIDQDSGDLSGAFWNDDDSTLNLSDAEADLSDDADDFEPNPSLIVIPEPAVMGAVSIGALMLRRNRRNAHSV